MAEAIQLYLIGGFLGSGKTTFLKNMLENFSGHKVGVLVNEFGNVSIDGTTLRRGDLQMVELNNGSIFCACLKDSFVKTLKAFSEEAIDILLVENSGMADPGSMNQILQQLQPALTRPYDYRGLICLVDSTTYLDYIDMLMPLQHQTETADFILVNKTDLVEHSVVQEIHQAIRQFNRSAVIYDTTFGQVPFDMLERQLENHGVILEGCCCNTKNSRPATYTLDTDVHLTLEQVTGFCTHVGKFALRVKGFLESGNGWIHADCVGKQINVAMAPADMQVDLEHGKLVIIGRDPDEFDDEVMFAWERYCGGHYQLVSTK